MSQRPPEISPEFDPAAPIANCQQETKRKRQIFPRTLFVPFVRRRVVHVNKSALIFVPDFVKSGPFSPDSTRVPGPSIASIPGRVHGRKSVPRRRGRVRRASFFSSLEWTSLFSSACGKKKRDCNLVSFFSSLVRKSAKFSSAEDRVGTVGQCAVLWSAAVAGSCEGFEQQQIKLRVVKNRPAAASSD